jgi:DNA-binding XRE family transcriptional regulator
MTAEIIHLRKVAKPRGPRRSRRPYKGSPEQQKARERRDDYYGAFGQRLRYARSQLGISKKETAAVLDVTLRTYRAYEAGKRSFVFHDGFLDFCVTFGVSLSWMVAGRGEPPRFRLRAV